MKHLEGVKRRASSVTDTVTTTINTWRRWVTRERFGPQTVTGKQGNETESTVPADHAAAHISPYENEEGVVVSLGSPVGRIVTDRRLQNTEAGASRETFALEDSSSPPLYQRPRGSDGRIIVHRDDTTYAVRAEGSLQSNLEGVTTSPIEEVSNSEWLKERERLDRPVPPTPDSDTEAVSPTTSVGGENRMDRVTSPEPILQEEGAMSSGGQNHIASSAWETFKRRGPLVPMNRDSTKGTLPPYMSPTSPNDNHRDQVWES